ncbi:DNA-directed RNA polymerase subunit H [archaeon]|nr:MAG: DNA-directed RNA polymerase subunit H [archaeon]RLG66165.1 MAG: DNA-directed RNA polymerase subunit H [archaeon]RLG66276.1 MAG: DNA-directed RNA polymerase subunit H [archaeon]HDM23940.1 DNA-directed RNA polymerase subunit H [Candidatus Bathyarchaeota archaeon]
MSKRRKEFKIEPASETNPDLTKHVLVPEHIVLSEEEAKKILSEYHTTLDQLPRILDTDPIVKQIGAKPGDVIKIIRRDDIAGRYVYFRRVVRASEVA